MTAGARSAMLARSLERSSWAPSLVDEPEIDSMPVDEPEPEHRSSLDALLHEAGREYLPADAFSFTSRP
jgi:hypothetical protein